MTDDNEQYQMYTPAGNACVAKWVEKTKIEFLPTQFTEDELWQAVRRVQIQVELEGFPEAFDSEVRYAISDELKNPIKKENSFGNAITNL